MKFHQAKQSAMAMRQWRENIGFSQRDAALALGLALKNYQFLEWGENREKGSPVVMNKRTALACAAIDSGLEPIYERYAGPPRSGSNQKVNKMVFNAKEVGFQRAVGLAMSHVIASKAARGESVVGVVLDDAELRDGRLHLEATGLSLDEQDSLGQHILQLLGDEDLMR